VAEKRSRHETGAEEDGVRIEAKRSEEKEGELVVRKRHP